MKAVLLYAYGDLGQLRYEETDMPKYGADEASFSHGLCRVQPRNHERHCRNAGVGREDLASASACFVHGVAAEPSSFTARGGCRHLLAESVIT